MTNNEQGETLPFHNQGGPLEELHEEALYPSD